MLTRPVDLKVKAYHHCPLAHSTDRCLFMQVHNFQCRHMLQELNWESLASRRRDACLVLFYKIHYGLVAVNMPLESKPTRKENSLAYHILSSSVDYQKNSLFYCTIKYWNCLPEKTVYASFPEYFRVHISP